MPRESWAGEAGSTRHTHGIPSPILSLQPRRGQNSRRRTLEVPPILSGAGNPNAVQGVFTAILGFYQHLIDDLTLILLSNGVPVLSRPRSAHPSRLGLSEPQSTNSPAGSRLHLGRRSACNDRGELHPSTWLGILGSFCWRELDPTESE